MPASVEVVKSNRTMYIGLCPVEGCTNGFTTPVYMKNKHSGKCKEHAFKGINSKRPYEWIIAKLKSRRQECTLSYEELLQLVNKPCGYCGTNVEHEPHCGKAYNLDRVDPTQGYVFENLISCCTPCNQFKWNNNKEVFINHCKKVANFNE